MHELLAETLDNPTAKAWLLDRQITANEVGLGLVEDTRAYLESLDLRARRDHARRPLGERAARQVRLQISRHGARGDRHHGIPAAAAAEHHLHPRHDLLDLRRRHREPLYWPARHEETLLATAIYKFHPSFANQVEVWWGDPNVNHGTATLEGGDVLVIGNGAVLIGMSERTSRQAITQLAAALFARTPSSA